MLPSQGFAALPLYVAVVEHGSFSAAARTLGLSKSAVSKRITQLEAALGTRLLQRTTRQLSLTEAGRRVYEHAAAAVAAAARAEDAAGELQDSPQGLLRINAPMSFGRLHVAPLVPKLLARYPGLRVDLVMDDRKVNLVEGGFDVAIRAGDLPDSTLVARKLAPCRHAICASPAYVDAHGAPSAPSELARRNCIVYSYAARPGEWTLSRHGVAETIDVSGNYRVNNSEALLEALAGGAGIGRLPTFVAGPAIADGRLVRLLEDYEIAPVAVYAVFPERRHLPAKTRAFVEFAAEHFGGDEPWWDRC